MPAFSPWERTVWGRIPAYKIVTHRPRPEWSSTAAGPPARRPPSRPPLPSPRPETRCRRWTKTWWLLRQISETIWEDATLQTELLKTLLTTIEFLDAWRTTKVHTTEPQSNVSHIHWLSPLPVDQLSERTNMLRCAQHCLSSTKQNHSVWNKWVCVQMSASACCYWVDVEQERAMTDWEICSWLIWEILTNKAKIF